MQQAKTLELNIADARPSGKQARGGGRKERKGRREGREQLGPVSTSDPPGDPSPAPPIRRHRYIADQAYLYSWKLQGREGRERERGKERKRWEGTERASKKKPHSLAGSAMAAPPNADGPSLRQASAKGEGWDTGGSG